MRVLCVVVDVGIVLYMDEHVHESDEAVVLDVCASNQERYAVLVSRYQSKLLRYATNLINDEQKAKDVVQETFIKAFINLKGFDTSKKFSSWIYRIAHNEAMNIVKKHKKEVRLPESFEMESEQDIEADYAEREIHDEIHKCLTMLPIIYAEPLLLRYIEEKTYEEISHILRIPVGTVGTRINRAKKIMKHLCPRQ